MAASPTLEGMPEEVRQHILTHVSGLAPIDFYVVTATEQQANVSKPIAALNGTDVVVRGFPVGPTLYVTEVVPILSDQPPGSALPPDWPAGRKLRQYTTPNPSSTPLVRWALEAYTDDLDALADSLADTSIRGRRIVRDTTPRKSIGAREISEAGHFLLVTPGGQLYLSATSEEDAVTKKRYDLSELSCSRITGRNMAAVRLAAVNERHRVENKPESSFLRIPNGRAIRTASGSTKKLLKLNSTFAIEVDVPIIATLPILSKIRVPTTDDMPTALREDPTMVGRIGLETNKWLACVPAEWVHHQQGEALNASPFTLADRIEAVRRKVEASARDNEPQEHARYMNRASRVLARSRPAASRNVLTPGSDGQLVMADVLAQGEGDTRVHDERDEPWSQRHIFGTSFRTLAPALVCTFFDRENTVVTDITNPERVRQLLAKAERSDFQAQYGLRSSLMGSVKPGEPMRATTKERCAKRGGNPLKRFLQSRVRSARAGPSAA